MKRILAWSFRKEESDAFLWDACEWHEAPDLVIAPFEYQREFYRRGNADAGVPVPTVSLDLAVARLGGKRAPARPAYGLRARVADAVLRAMPAGPLDRVRGTTGFVRSFLGWMYETERQGAEPSALLNDNEEAIRWLAEAGIRTEEALRQMGWKNRRSWLRAVEEQGVPTGGQRILVDGFLEFSVEEWRLLTKIAEHNDVVIVMPRVGESHEEQWALRPEDGERYGWKMLSDTEETDKPTERQPRWLAATGPLLSIRLALTEAVRLAGESGWDAVDIVVGDPSLWPLLLREAKILGVPISAKDTLSVAQTAVGREFLELVRIHALPLTAESLPRRLACRLFPLPSEEMWENATEEEQPTVWAELQAEMEEERQAFQTFLAHRMASVLRADEIRRVLLRSGASPEEVRINEHVLQRLPLLLEEAETLRRELRFTEEQLFLYWEDILTEESVSVAPHLHGLKVSAFSDALGLKPVCHRVLLGFGATVPVLEETNFLLRSPFMRDVQKYRADVSATRLQFLREAIRFDALVSQADVVTVVLDAPAEGEQAMQSPLLGHRFGVVPTKYEKQWRTSVPPIPLALTEEQVAAYEAMRGESRAPKQPRPSALYRGLPARYSASALETYVACPFQYWVKYVMEGFETEDADLRRERGTAQHAALARYLENTQERIAETLRNGEIPVPDTELLERIIEEEGKRAALPPIVTERLKRLLLPFVELDLDRMATHPQLRSFAVEEDFQARLTRNGRTVELFGRIDRLEKSEDGTQLLIDFKSGMSAADKKALSEGRSLQMPLYSLIHQNAYAAYGMIRGLHFSARFVPEEWTRYDSKSNFSASEWDRLRVQTENTVFDTDESIRAGQFPLRPSEEVCRFCAFAAVCRKAEGGER